MAIHMRSRVYTTGALISLIMILRARSLDMQTLVVGILLKVERILIKVTMTRIGIGLAVAGQIWMHLVQLYAQAPIPQSTHIPMVLRRALWIPVATVRAMRAARTAGPSM